MNKLNSFDSNLDIKFCSYELRIYQKDIGTVQDINYPFYTAELVNIIIMNTLNSNESKLI